MEKTKLEKEIKRVLELKKMYEEIGPAGFFGVATITGAVNMAESAIRSGNEDSMKSALENLKDIEG